MVGEHATMGDEVLPSDIVAAERETLDDLYKQLQILAERVGNQTYDAILTRGEVYALIYCIQRDKATRNQHQD